MRIKNVAEFKKIAKKFLYASIWKRNMKGRPIGSKVRNNIQAVLLYMKKGYGYEIHKAYIDIFPGASQRLIYYHLKKGVSTGEIEVESVKKEQGSYSWGSDAEKKYYKLGEKSNPRNLKKVEKYFDNRNKKNKNMKDK